MNTFMSGVKKSAPEKPAEPVAPVAEETESPVDPSGAEPYGVTTVTTPSGLEVYYQAGPKRLYKLRMQGDVEWIEDNIVSMSDVPGILDKPGLVSWAEKSGVNLVQELVRQGFVDLEFLKEFRPDDPPNPRQPWWGGKHLLEIGKVKKLRTGDHKDEAAGRGNSVHDALEAWAMGGDLPDADLYPESERGYVRGLVKFLTESDPEPLMSEVVVGSIDSKVAGRFDLFARMPKKELVYHLTGKGEKTKTFHPKTRLLDLKTSAGVYESHHIQTAGYMGCMEECGYDRPDDGAILRVTQDGRYELIDVAAEWLDFILCRELYDSLTNIRQRSHQTYRLENR